MHRLPSPGLESRAKLALPRRGAPVVCVRQASAPAVYLTRLLLRGRRRHSRRTRSRRRSPRVPFRRESSERCRAPAEERLHFLLGHAEPDWSDSVVRFEFNRLGQSGHSLPPPPRNSSPQSGGTWRSSGGIVSVYSSACRTRGPSDEHHLARRAAPRADCSRRSQLLDRLPSSPVTPMPPSSARSWSYAPVSVMTVLAACAQGLPGGLGKSFSPIR